jgi:predicted nucleic acid-binding protein
VVIVDTSVWIEYFNRPQSAEKHAVDVLIDTDTPILIGVVLAELLQGCRASKEADTLLLHLRALPFLEMTFASWRRTGGLSSALRQRGITLPLSDLIVAALAQEHGCSVFTLDPHFRQIPGLRLYRPPKSRKRFPSGPDQR